jgi:sulfur-oxidizing protein SoxX
MQRKACSIRPLALELSEPHAEPALRTLNSLLAALTVLAALPAGAATAGDAVRGRALLLQRQDSGCILCHVLPGLPPGGALGPPLSGLASRYTAEELRLRIADARRYNPQTIMPPYFSTEGLHNVARSYAGTTALAEQALADIVAYLLQAPGDERR